MIPLKIYRNAYASLEEAEKDGAVYEALIDDDSGITSIHFRDTLASIESTVKTSLSCIGLDTDTLVLRIQIPKGNYVSLTEFSAWSYAHRCFRSKNV